MHKLSNQILDLREIEKLATNFCKSISVGDICLFQGELGAGKTTLVKMLSEVDNYDVSISHTTRQPRPNEVSKKDYFFVDENEFNRLIKNEEFLEYAKVFNNFYGTTRTPVIDKLNKKKKCFI